MLMKFLNKVFYLIPLVLFFSGCTKDEPKGLTDAELILAIIDAEDKTEVDIESLPMVARSTMEDNYLSEYYHLNTYKASTLGYEVFIAGKPGRLGKRSEVYFDITGNKLDYAEYERDVMSNDDDFYKFSLKKANEENTGIWCNARIKAVPMYARCGFEIVSDIFEIESIGPHYDMEWK